MNLTTSLFKNFSEIFYADESQWPWEFIAEIEKIILMKISQLDENYNISNDIAIHKSAHVDKTASLKGPIILSENVFIGNYSLLRGGVFIGKKSSIGSSCEIKSAIISNDSSIAHFNFVGDRVIGSDVNMEAGAILANHYNERKDKSIFVMINGNRINTHCEKFGSLVGDGSKIGANAVLSPGTILQMNSIIKRLELVEQDKL